MKSEKDVRKAHIILLICQVITFTLALTLGICVIVIKQIKSGYSLAFFARIFFFASLARWDDGSFSGSFCLINSLFWPKNRFARKVEV